MAVIGALSRLRGAHENHGALEIAASKITEITEVTSGVAKCATLAEPGIAAEVAALGTECVGRGVRSLAGPRVISGITEEGIGDHAADHD
ncbi:MAG TPA: hypothetical protein VFP85_06525, partial [Vicinamibacterales bacterium]|nr:hypothetical protein [Vicinamibacterales bacterium]